MVLLERLVVDSILMELTPLAKLRFIFWLNIVKLKGVPIILKVLLNAGAHIDQGTPDGETLRSILNQQQLQLHLPSYYPFESLADNPLNVVLPLSCYCAQSIRRNGIPYEDQLPARFHEIVSIH